MKIDKKPAEAPKGWRGKPNMEHYGEMKPISHVSRPNLLMRIGSWFFERRTGK